MLTKKLLAYCIKYGIQMHHIVPYTPWKNNFMERDNHTLKELADCMIQFMGSRPHFLVESINFENT